MNKTNFLVTIVFDEDSDIKKQTNTEFSLKNKIIKELQHLVKDKEIKHFIVADDEVINDKLKEEPKIGYWKRAKDKTGHLVWECDKCGWQQRFANNYCPDCGQRNQKVRDKQ